MNLQVIERVKALLAEAADLLAESPAHEVDEPRAIQKLARDVRPGDIICHIEIAGPAEVLGWGKHDGKVTLLVTEGRYVDLLETSLVWVRG